MFGYNKHRFGYVCCRVLAELCCNPTNSNMNITLTGSLGPIGQPLAQTLVQQGHAVTVISSKPEKQADIEAAGAKAAIGSIEDADFLTSAFTGADAVFTMVPRPNFFAPGFDPMAHCKTVVRNYAQAIERSGVKRVVHLSSIGAHMEKGSGLILVHHEAEQILNELTDAGITFMRPVGFYYNLLSFVPMIKGMGAISSNYGGDDVIPWVSPKDIAAAIAEEIVTPLTGRNVRYVASEELTCNEVAGILGAAIDKPDLQWNVISDEHMKSGMEAAGMPGAIAGALVEMQASMHNGELYRDYYRNKPEMGTIKLADFAKEFAAVYAR